MIDYRALAEKTAERAEQSIAAKLSGNRELELSILEESWRDSEEFVRTLIADAAEPPKPDEAGDVPEWFVDAILDSTERRIPLSAMSDAWVIPLWKKVKAEMARQLAKERDDFKASLDASFAERNRLAAEVIRWDEAIKKLQNENNQMQSSVVEKSKRIAELEAKNKWLLRPAENNEINRHVIKAKDMEGTAFEAVRIEEARELVKRERNAREAAEEAFAKERREATVRYADAASKAIEQKERADAIERGEYREGRDG